MDGLLGKVLGLANLGFFGLLSLLMGFLWWLLFGACDFGELVFIVTDEMVR